MNVEEAARGLPLGRNVEILATHPAGLVALHKPEGVLSHPNRKEKKSPSLLQRSYDDQLQAFVGSDEADSAVPFHLLHRLDSPTSGVILGSLDVKLAKQVRRLFADRQVLKIYHALTQEKGPGRNETWTDRLEIVRQDGKLRGKRSVRGREAITAVCFERQRIGRNGLSLIRLEPSTGITHQLRIQASLRGFPIVGDRTYGDFSLNRRIGRDKRARRLFLHASQIVLEFSWQGKNIRFEAESPLPRSFGKAMT